MSEDGITYTRLDGDGRWTINVMVNRVRRHEVIGLESQGFTLTQARDRISELKAKKREQVHGIKRAATKAATLTAAARLYLSHLEEVGGKDIAKKRQRLDTNILPLLGGLLIGAITTTELRKYAKKRADAGAAPSTINREFAVLSHLFKLSADPEALGLLPTKPCAIPRLKEPEGKTAYLQPTQAAKLLKEAAADENEHVHAFAMVGLHTGMRYSPILRIETADIDLAHRGIWINKDKAGERLQPITADLAAYLRAYLKTRDGKWLFPSPRSATGHAVNVRKAWRRVVKAAKLEGVITPHTMRHTMATQAAHAGVDSATLQALGGWKTRVMAERYTHPASLNEAMDKLQARYTVTQKLQSQRKSKAKTKAVSA
ncbi:tyrosine-type recombinase/integrase [Lysobacter rhizosphaerae]